MLRRAAQAPCLRAPLSSNVRAQRPVPDSCQLNLGLARVGCDFNARGLSEEAEDTCFYSFSRSQVDLLPSLIGSRVVLFDFDSKTEVTACEALVESYRTGWRGEPEQSFWFCGVRARPVEGTWYWGPVPWQHAL
jgi:hypothetical protein